MGAEDSDDLRFCFVPLSTRVQQHTQNRQYVYGTLVPNGGIRTLRRRWSFNSFSLPHVRNMRDIRTNKNVILCLCVAPDNLLVDTHRDSTCGEAHAADVASNISAARLQSA